MTEMRPSKDGAQRWQEQAKRIVVVIGLINLAVTGVLLLLSVSGRLDLDYVAALTSTSVVIFLATVNWERLRRPSALVWVAALLGYAVSGMVIWSGVFHS